MNATTQTPGRSRELTNRRAALKVTVAALGQTRPIIKDGEHWLPLGLMDKNRPRIRE
jgi:hypothetical protein